LENKLVYWLALSIKWLKFIQVDDELRKEIKDASTNPAFPQNLRHKMRQAINAR
jgi:hypothetical protein